MNVADFSLSLSLYVVVAYFGVFGVSLISKDVAVRSQQKLYDI